MWSKISDYTNGPSLETNTAQNLSHSEGWVLCVARQDIPCSPESNIFFVERMGNPMWPGQEFHAAQNFSSDLWYPFCGQVRVQCLQPRIQLFVSMLNRINFKCVFERICTRVWPCQVLHAFSTELIFVAFKGVIPLHGHTFSFN